MADRVSWRPSTGTTRTRGIPAGRSLPSIGPGMRHPGVGQIGGLGLSRTGILGQTDEDWDLRADPEILKEIIERNKLYQGAGNEDLGVTDPMSMVTHYRVHPEDLNRSGEVNMTDFILAAQRHAEGKTPTESGLNVPGSYPDRSRMDPYNWEWGQVPTVYPSGGFGSNKKKKIKEFENMSRKIREKVAAAKERGETFTPDPYGKYIARRRRIVDAGIAQKLYRDYDADEPYTMVDHILSATGRMPPGRWRNSPAGKRFYASPEGQRALRLENIAAVSQHPSHSFSVDDAMSGGSGPNPPPPTLDQFDDPGDDSTILDVGGFDGMPPNFDISTPEPDLSYLDVSPPWEPGPGDFFSVNPSAATVDAITASGWKGGGLVRGYFTGGEAMSPGGIGEILSQQEMIETPGGVAIEEEMAVGPAFPEVASGDGTRDEVMDAVMSKLIADQSGEPLSEFENDAADAVIEAFVSENGPEALGEIVVEVASVLGIPVGPEGAMAQETVSEEYVSPEGLTEESVSVIDEARGFRHGGSIMGPGDGMSDSISATIDGVEPIVVSSGETIIPADATAALGNGSTEAGAQRLMEMVDRIRMARTGTPRQPAAINPRDVMIA